MKNLDFAVLLDVYGCMLTDKQRSAAESYYWEDLSLGEIAQNMGITRQAVRDSIKRSEQTVAELEDKLKLSEKYANAKAVLNKIAELSCKPSGTAQEEKQNTMKQIHELAVKGRELFS